MGSIKALNTASDPVESPCFQVLQGLQLGGALSVTESVRRHPESSQQDHKPEQRSHGERQLEQKGLKERIAM